jgi:16S rRNA (cytosine967-C5)-methyltransferase
VLVDAPCSGLGTLRRNPDARWRLRPGDPGRLCEIQRAILRNAAAALGPSGVLVYSTCTMLPEENEQVVESFLAENPGYERVAGEAPEEVRELVDAQGYLRTLPSHHDADAFVAVRIRRT